jgi:proteasome lid subunit RPN8/RPN11
MTADPPDIHQLRKQNLPETPFPGSSEQAFRVFFSDDVHARIWQHSQETTAVEICGVLVGKLSKDAGGPFVTITEAIRGEAATNKFAEVTFTHETWAKINHEMDTKYTQLNIVGWYHSHPDFGIFLSDRDMFIQQHFFSGPGQLAFVVDPIRHAEGVFVWKKGKTVLAPHYWIGDRIQVGGLTSFRFEGSQPAPATGGAPAAADGAKPVAFGPWFDRIIYILGFISLFFLGFLVSHQLSAWDKARAEEDAVARAAVFLGVKPGLRESLIKTLADVEESAKIAAALAKAHRAAANPLPEDQEHLWQAIEDDLRRTRLRLLSVEASYCLSEAETVRYIQYAAALMARSTQGITAADQLRLARDLEALLQQGMDKGLFELPKTSPPATKPTSSAPSQPAAPAAKSEPPKE